MIDASAFQLLLMVTGWFARRERELIFYLIEETGASDASWVRGACA